MTNAMWQRSSAHRRSMGPSLGLDQIPSVVQIHKWDLFKLGSPGNCIVDDIHSHWESYFQKYGVLADMPYSKFQATEGWDTVYTWDSLEKHKPALTHTYGKKVTKLSLMVVVAPTTTEIGDDYFLKKLHESACIKRRSVYYGAKVAGKKESHAGGHLSLLQSVVSECSFWLLPHLEALGSCFCMWRLQTVPHGGSQEAPRASWKVQGGISRKSSG